MFDCSIYSISGFKSMIGVHPMDCSSDSNKEQSKKKRNRASWKKEMLKV